MSSTSLTPKEVATLVDGDLFISTDQTITGINSLSEADHSEVSFLGNEKYYKDFLETKSRLVIAPPILKDAPEGVGIIHVENPTLAFSKVIEHFAAQQAAVAFTISAQAIISETAQIAEGVAIKAGAIIGEHVSIGKGSIIHSGVVLNDNVRIGENTILFPNVTVRENCIIGSGVRLQPGVVIGSDGYGYEQVDGKHLKIPQIGTVIIEDDVEIGSNSCIDRARFGKTIIGEGTKIDNLVQVGHNVILGKHNLLVAQCGLSGSTQTEDHVIIGPQSGVVGHLKIGSGVVLAGQSGIAKTITKAGYYQGTPARPIMDSRRSKAIVNKLPAVMARIKELEKQVAELTAED